MKKLIAFLGFLVGTVGMEAIYLMELPGNEILRTIIGIILFAIWLNSLAVVLAVPNKRRRRRRR